MVFGTLSWVKILSVCNVGFYWSCTVFALHLGHVVLSQFFDVVLLHRFWLHFGGGLLDVVKKIETDQGLPRIWKIKENLSHDVFKLCMHMRVVHAPRQILIVDVLNSLLGCQKLRLNRIKPEDLSAKLFDLLFFREISLN